MVVMPRHRRRFMTDDGLHDMQRNPGVCRERDESVPQRVERRLWGPVLAAFEAGYDDTFAEATGPKKCQPFAMYA